MTVFNTPLGFNGAAQVARIQTALRETGLPAWLFYAFQDVDPIAKRILGATAQFQTRRWLYLVPVAGEPVKLLHKIEPHQLDHLPGRVLLYAGWRELEQRLAEMLQGVDRVAMQYSPRNAIPYISRVDAGTVELVRSAGAEVVTSADLVARLEAIWTPRQLDLHRSAADALRRIVDETFASVRAAITAGTLLNEYGLQQFMLERFTAHRLISAAPPIVAVGAHSGDPHYTPDDRRHASIGRGDFLLIDLWGKHPDPDAVYADITWTGFAGSSVPPRYEEVFQVVRGGRDAAIEFVRARWAARAPVHGWEVDDAARRYIAERGFGDAFIHRTGHSIGLEDHWNGANIDNYETRDERRLLPRTCFSIEPGVYLPEFGVRSEVDVYVGDTEVLVTGQPIQDHVVPILA